jgi:hypothetical protein
MQQWTMIARTVLTKPAGTKWPVRKHRVLHPLDVGMRVSTGLPAGQFADYRLKLVDCSGLHVQDYGDHYLVHWDRTDPACDLVQHLVQDAPGTYLAGATLLGGLVGALLGRSDKAMVAGALIGAAIGGVAIAADEQQQAARRNHRNGQQCGLRQGAPRPRR